MTENVPASRDRVPRKWLVPTGIATLLALHFVLANAANWNKGATFDENSHIGNGLSFWATGDFRMGPESILPQRWMSLPIYLGGFTRPSTETESWYEADVWGYSRDLLYRLDNDGQTILRLARGANSLWSLALAWVTFVWARSLFGTAGGFVAMLLYVLSPLVLANAALATNDTATAFMFTASTFALWRLLQRVSPARLAVSALLVGAAFATKLSAVLLIPIGLGLAIVRVAAREPIPIRWRGNQRDVASRLVRIALILGLVLVHVVTAWCVIWALFNFRYEKFTNYVEGRDVPFTGTFDEVLANMQAPIPPSTEKRNFGLAMVIEVFRRLHLLPEAFLYVNANAVSTTSARSAFLNGRYGIYGFPSFFLYCFLYKTPLAVFGLFLPAAAAHVARRVYQVKVERRRVLGLLWEGFYAATPLWCLLAVYWIVSITSALNIGARHLLPTFPATFVLAGMAGLWLVPLRRGIAAASSQAAEPEPPSAVDVSERSEPFLARPFCGAMRAAVAGLLILLAASVLSASPPGYFCYFNEIAGGPAGGYRHLVDSSLDWGQELPNLKRFLDAEVLVGPNPPAVFVSLFGSTPPSAVGLKNVAWLPCFFPIADLEGEAPPPTGLYPGVYCISDTNLQCVYNAPFPGPWRVDFEHNYQVLIQLVQAFELSHNDPTARAAADARLRKVGLNDWPTVFQLYETARFGRLCAFLRRRTPDETIHHAISIYKLSADDLTQALFHPPVEQYPAPEKPTDNVPY